MAKITRLNDSAGDVLYSEIEQLLTGLERFADLVSVGRLIALDCQHVKNHVMGFRDDNREQRREYDPARDDNSLVLIDRIGLIIHDDGFTPSVAPMLLRMMHGQVSRLRVAVATRLMAYLREQAGVSVPAQAQRREANRAT